LKTSDLFYRNKVTSKLVCDHFVCIIACQCQARNFFEDDHVNIGITNEQAAEKCSSSYVPCRKESRLINWHDEIPCGFTDCYYVHYRCRLLDDEEEKGKLLNGACVFIVIRSTENEFDITTRWTRANLIIQLCKNGEHRLLYGISCEPYSFCSIREFMTEEHSRMIYVQVQFQFHVEMQVSSIFNE
jgi:hypothetical protein